MNMTTNMTHKINNFWDMNVVDFAIECAALVFEDEVTEPQFWPQKLT